MLFARYRDLQSMCLHVIAANLKKLINCNQIPQIHIEFLHRAYAERLFRIVMCEGYISKIECILWFLTPYQKQVTLNSMYGCTQDVFNKIHAIGSVITSLNLSELFCSESVLSALICCVPNVKRVILRLTACTDQVLLCLMKMCPLVITLDLRETEVSDKGIESLCSGSEIMVGDQSFALKNLDVSDTRVTQDGISLILKYMPYLEVLRHEDLSVILYELHKADIHNCDKNVKYNLTEFVHFASDEDLLNILEVWTVICPNIKTIIIEDFINGKHVSMIKRFTQLREAKLINCGNYKVTSEVTSTLFVKGEMLTSLFLLHTTISIKTLAQFCKSIKSIFFKDVTFEDSEEPNLITELYPLDNLTSLTVRHLDFSTSSTSKSMNLLICLSHNLRELRINFAKNFSEEFTHLILNSSPKLWSVDFSFTDIKVPFILPFFKCKTIERICIITCVNISRGSPEFRHFLDFNYKKVFSWQEWNRNQENDDDVEKLSSFSMDF